MAPNFWIENAASHVSLGTIPLSLGIAALLVWKIPSDIYRLYRWIAFWVTTGVYCYTVFIWVLFTSGHNRFQFVTTLLAWPSQNLICFVGLDSLSLFFLILTTFLFPLCVVYSWDHLHSQRLFTILLTLEFFLVLAFTVLDLFFFCVFFESLLLPMVFLMLFDGTQGRRIYALTYLYMYTLFGSLFVLLALFMFHKEVHTTNYLDLVNLNMGEYLSPWQQRGIWALLFVTFAIKVPVFPFHIWLPEAHVEAPTVGSVILAGLLLKLGGYGIVRFLFLLPDAVRFFQAPVLWLCLFSALLASWVAIGQKDMKRMIAYSSVAHMNFSLLGYFSLDSYGHAGATCLMLSHAVVSAALFFLIGILYTRGGDRNFYKYAGLTQLMPLFITGVFMFSISNFSFPGTSNFVGELLVLISLAHSSNFFILVIALFTTYYGLVYSMSFFNQLANGNLKMPNGIKMTFDIWRNEFYTVVPLIGINFAVGLMPSMFLRGLYIYTEKILEKLLLSAAEVLKTLSIPDWIERVTSQDPAYRAALLQEIYEMLLSRISDVEASGFFNKKQFAALAAELYKGRWLRNTGDSALYHLQVELLHMSDLFKLGAPLYAEAFDAIIIQIYINAHVQYEKGRLETQEDLIVFCENMRHMVNEMFAYAKWTREVEIKKYAMPELADMLEQYTKSFALLEIKLKQLPATNTLEEAIKAFESTLPGVATEQYKWVSDSKTFSALLRDTFVTDMLEELPGLDLTKFGVSEQDISHWKLDPKLLQKYWKGEIAAAELIRYEITEEERSLWFSLLQTNLTMNGRSKMGVLGSTRTSLILSEKMPLRDFIIQNFKIDAAQKKKLQQDQLEYDDFHDQLLPEFDKKIKEFKLQGLTKGTDLQLGLVKLENYYYQKKFGILEEDSSLNHSFLTTDEISLQEHFSYGTVGQSYFKNEEALAPFYKALEAKIFTGDFYILWEYYKECVDLRAKALAKEHHFIARVLDEKGFITRKELLNRTIAEWEQAIRDGELSIFYDLKTAVYSADLEYFMQAYKLPRLPDTVFQMKVYRCNAGDMWILPGSTGYRFDRSEAGTDFGRLIEYYINNVLYKDILKPSNAITPFKKIEAVSDINAIQLVWAFWDENEKEEAKRLGFDTDAWDRILKERFENDNQIVHIATYDIWEKKIKSVGGDVEDPDMFASEITRAVGEKAEEAFNYGGCPSAGYNSDLLRGGILAENAYKGFPTLANLTNEQIEHLGFGKYYNVFKGLGNSLVPPYVPYVSAVRGTGGFVFENTDVWMKYVVVGLIQELFSTEGDKKLDPNEYILMVAAGAQGDPFKKKIIYLLEHNPDNYKLLVELSRTYTFHKMYGGSLGGYKPDINFGAIETWANLYS